MRFKHLLALSCGIFTAFITSDAFARRPDQCGVFDDRDAKKLYREANRVWHLFDIREDINYTCTVMEQLESWREKREDSFSDAEEDYLDNLQEYAQEEFFSLGEPIAALKAWKDVDTTDTIQRAKRIANIREAKQNLQSRLDDLNLSLNDIIRFSKEKDRALRIAKENKDTQTED